MRVAIFHDTFGAIGGGERTALTLARAWNAPVYTTIVHRPSIDRLGYGDVNVVSLGELYPRPPLRFVDATLKFARVRVDADAFVLSGSWATWAGRRHHPNILYCYTPIREFYDLREPILRREPSRVNRVLERTWSSLHRAWDRIAWSEVDRVVAISDTVRRRIRTFLGRESSIVYPPTDVSRYRFEAVGDFWLSVNRLYPEKRLELQFDAFRRLPRERLVIVGGYSRGDEMAPYVGSLGPPPPNVELLGEVPEDDLLRLYAQCRGLVCTALDEDFGLTPVEAMASGKVVVAVDEGGFRESIVPGETGWLLPADPEAFAARIRALRDDDLAAHADACRRRALRFDIRIFLDAMTSILGEAMAQ